MSSTVTCPYCKKSFEISDAIGHQIEEELLRAKTEQSDRLRKEFDVQAEERIKQAVQSAVTEAQQAVELQIVRERQAAKLELEKAKQSTELEVEKAKQSTELETELLRHQAESAKREREAVARAAKIPA